MHPHSKRYHVAPQGFYQARHSPLRRRDTIHQHRTAANNPKVVASACERWLWLWLWLEPDAFKTLSWIRAEYRLC